MDIIVEWNAVYLPGWPSKVKTANVRDLWLHKDLGTFTNQFQAQSLEAHESLFLKVTPKA